MKHARVIRVFLFIINVATIIRGDEINISDDDDNSKVPDFSFPEFDPGNSLFSPKGVIEGMILGDILMRVQNLEAFCEVDGKKFEKLPETAMPPSLLPKPRHQEQGKLMFC